MHSMDTMGPQTFSVLLCTLLMASVNCAKPKMEIIPSNGEIYLGESKYFICKVSSDAALKWLTSDDEEIEDEPGRYQLKTLDETTMGLSVIKLGMESDQIIKCQATFESDETIEKEIMLTVIKKPKIVGNFETVKEFTAGTTAELRCSADGIPAPKVSWLRDGQALPSSQVGLSIRLDGTLEIKNIQLSDAGTYTCKASIEKRDEVDTKNVSVIVNAAPVVRFETDNTNATIKSNTSLTCLVTGNPKPTVTWHRGSELLQHDGEKYILSSNGRELSILDLEKSDEGEYTCNATNSFGENGATLVLEVLNPEPQQLGVGVIAGILLVLLLAVLLAVDLTCYRTKRRGFLMYISTSLLKKSIPRVKLEETESKKGSADKSQVVNISGIDA
ncbi:neural cell adhesion molecule 1-like [Spea bombifrons]|uniref:neural cell adhesion molecule 1-like n=1 Tax=Spea bombifrons TaxID=233779 RepID=UPI002349CC89|nr:neural cell adhesion molecule 1-like [Spea bombifrons]